MDYKFIHVPRIGCLGFITFEFPKEIYVVSDPSEGCLSKENEFISLLSQEEGILLKIQDTLFQVHV